MFRGRSVSLFLCLLVSFYCLSATGLAQSNFGSIRGQVRDGSGAAVPGATVRITDIGTNAEVVLT
ncbi:MAG: carboxypeptidase-like regulatory domain-containing protein, partial [Blastocatellia bacterium]